MNAGIRITHRHGARGVAMIAALEGDKALAPGETPVEPELHRHLHRDLDRDRSGFGKEHAVEIARQQRSEPPRQRQRALVSEAAEHHMWHDGKLALNRGADMGMIVAVARGPPGGDPVDELASIAEHEPTAVRAHDWERRPRCAHLRIRQPDMGQPGGIPVGSAFAHRLVAWEIAIMFNVKSEMLTSKAKLDQ